MPGVRAEGVAAIERNSKTSPRLPIGKCPRKHVRAARHFFFFCLSFWAPLPHLPLGRRRDAAVPVEPPFFLPSRVLSEGRKPARQSQRLR
jgi:hypothetical protein